MKMQFKQHALKLALASAFALGAAGLSINSYAAASTADLDVTASIGNACTISSSALAFGVYDPIVTNATVALNGTGTISSTCTLDVPAKITLGQGSNPDTGSTDAIPARQMSSGANRLGYAIFSETTRNTVWGNTDSTGKAANGTGNALVLTAYGAIPAGQAKPTGSYADIVVATITF